MKKITLLLMLMGSLVNAQTGAHFEYKMTTAKGASNMKINFSEYGSSMEFTMNMPQMPNGGITMRSLTKKSTPDVTYTLNETNKTYTENKKSSSSPTQTEDTRTYTVKKLGNETVNGYKCVHAMVTDEKESYEVWNTKDIKEYNQYADVLTSNKKIASSKRNQALKDAGCDGFMVKSIHKGSEREGEVTMELVKMEKKNFTAADFEIPAGYTKSEGSSAANPAAGMGFKSQQELMSMTPEERAKYIEEMKKKYGKEK